MIFYKLNDAGSKWIRIKTSLNADDLNKKWIGLYNDDLTFKGVGIYPKSRRYYAANK